MGGTALPLRGGKATDESKEWIRRGGQIAMVLLGWQRKVVSHSVRGGHSVSLGRSEGPPGAEL